MKLCVLALLPLIVCSQEAPKLRLPGDVQPVRYELELNLTPSNDAFNGKVVDRSGGQEADVSHLASFKRSDDRLGDREREAGQGDCRAEPSSSGSREGHSRPGLRGSRLLTPGRC